MKYYGDEGKPSPAEVLAHHGVKGMKWGVHQQRKLDTYNRVAAGKGTARDHIHMVRTLSPLELAAAGGSYKKAAAKRAVGWQARKERFESGNATIRDKANRLLYTPLPQLVRGK